MNLHAIVAGVIGTVNEPMLVTVQVSTGPGPTARDGKRSPTYAAPFNLWADVQAFTTKDLQLIDRLNIQKSDRAIYFNGEVDAIIRMSQKGGDLVTLPDGTVYLTTAVIERWGAAPDWCRVAVTLQNGS